MRSQTRLMVVSLVKTGGGAMEDMSTTSSSDDEPQRVHRSARLSADRGEIKREAWAAASGSESASGSGSETEEEANEEEEEDPDDIPLAQREEADDEEDSGEETDEDVLDIKQEDVVSADGDLPAEDDEEEADDESEAESDDDRDEVSQEEADSDAISIKSEQEAEMGERGDGRRSAQDSKHSRSDSDLEEATSEVDDVRRRGAADQATPLREAEEANDFMRDERGHVETRRSARVARRDSELAGQRMRDDDQEQKDADGEESAYDEEEELEVEEEQDGGETITKRDVTSARSLMNHLLSVHLSFTEQSELHKGTIITGPPIDRPISQADQWKRKYRWPVALRNVRRRRFVANADEITADHEVRLVDASRAKSGVSDRARKAFAAALAPTARPLMSTAVATFRELKEKREREMNFVERLEETKEENDPEGVDPTHLRALTRLGGHFTDQLLDSVLAKNLLALQGVDASYAQQCWDPLPTSKRPVANWRFILEHFCRTSSHGVDALSITLAPRLRKDTLQRIRDRLRALYGVSWRPEDDTFFDLVDQQEIDPPEASEVVPL